VSKNKTKRREVWVNYIPGDNGADYYERGEHESEGT